MTLIYRKTVADDLLPSEKKLKILLIKIDWLQIILEWKYCSKLQVVKRASVKQLFTNYFGITYYFIHQFIIMEDKARKKNGNCFSIGIKKYSKLISLKKIWLNTTINISKIQLILPKIKTCFLSIKIGLPRKTFFKPTLYVTDFTSFNVIGSEPFNACNEDISLLNDSALHWDHKYW